MGALAMTVAAAALAACGSTTAPSVSSNPTGSAVVAQTRAPQTAPPTPAATASPVGTASELIAIAEKVYGKGELAMCDGGGGNNVENAFKDCPFTASLTQEMIRRSVTSLGPNPLCGCDGLGPQGVPAYVATVTSTGGTVVATIDSAIFGLTIVKVNGKLLVNDLTNLTPQS